MEKAGLRLDRIWINRWEREKHVGLRKIIALKTQDGPKPRDSRAGDKFQGKLLYSTAPAEPSLNAFDNSPFSSDPYL